jgi:hypothetical protein
VGLWKLTIYIKQLFRSEPTSKCYDHAHKALIHKTQQSSGVLDPWLQVAFVEGHMSFVVTRQFVNHHETFSAWNALHTKQQADNRSRSYDSSE